MPQTEQSTLSQAAENPPRLLRFPEVMARTGKSRAGIYAAINQGDFPCPVKLGSMSVAFIESEINAWIESRERADIQVNPAA